MGLGSGAWDLVDGEIGLIIKVLEVVSKVRGAHPPRKEKMTVPLCTIPRAGVLSSCTECLL